MREAVFILLVVVALVGLTIWRYRRVISAVLQFRRDFARAAREAQLNAAQLRKPEKGVELIRCAKCGICVPADKALTRRGLTFCSQSCRG
jgi:hypothetical protein